MHVDSAGVESGNRKSDIGLDMLDARVVSEEALWWIRDNRVLAAWDEGENPIEAEASVGVLRIAREEERGDVQGAGPGVFNRIRHQDRGARAGPRKVHTRPTKSCSKRSSTSQPGSERSRAEGAVMLRKYRISPI